MELKYVFLLLIFLVIILSVASYYIGSENPQIRTISEASMREIIYPKSPIDARPENFENLNEIKDKPESVKIDDDYIHIPKIKMSNEPKLPPGFTPVYDQDETMTNVLELNEHFNDNGTIKTRKIVIQKRYNNESKGEAIVRRVLEDIYGAKFDRVRPNFLRYHTGKNLELDCWCEKYKIGAEYNGKQHYIRVAQWQSTDEKFIAQIQKDVFKYEKMNELGYYLITIPYTVDHSMIRLYIEYYLPENVKKRQQNILEF